jgi:hypothetical protein
MAARADVPRAGGKVGPRRKSGALLFLRGPALVADCILNGDNPAKLPRQAPRKHELTINLKTANALQAGHALGGDVAEQQADAEQQHQPRGTEFQAAHDEGAAAFAGPAQAPGQVFC